MKIVYSNEKLNIYELNFCEGLKKGHPFSKYMIEIIKMPENQIRYLTKSDFLMGILNDMQYHAEIKPLIKEIENLKEQRTGLNMKITKMEISNKNASDDSERKMSVYKGIMKSLEEKLSKKREKEPDELVKLYEDELKEKEKLITFLNEENRKLRIEQSSSKNGQDVMLNCHYDPKLEKCMKYYLEKILLPPKKTRETRVFGADGVKDKHDHPKKFDGVITKIKSNDFIVSAYWRRTRPACGTKIKDIKKDNGKYSLSLTYSDGGVFGAEIKLDITAKNDTQADFIKCFIEKDLDL